MEYVADDVGPVIVTAGADVSVAPTVHVNVCEAVSTPSETVAVTVNEPGVVSEP